MPAQQFTAIETCYADGPAGRVFRSARAFSATSQADARQKAAALAQAEAKAAAIAEISPSVVERERYPYGVRDLIEPELDRIMCDGAPIARITRNNYGASVLNADNVMFVDVDIGQMSRNPRTGLPLASEQIVSKDEAFAALTDLVAMHSGLAFRVYATAAGLRYLCINRLFNPDSSESEEILKSLKSDKRYIVLCRKQKCYRARLTPKPWRCCKEIPLTPEERQTAPKGFFAKLFGGSARRTKVLRKPEDFAVCHYLETVGMPAPVMLPEIAEIMRMHDEQCGIATAKPLA
jgi:hypothetical protein